MTLCIMLVSIMLVSICHSPRKQMSAANVCIAILWLFKVTECHAWMIFNRICLLIKGNVLLKCYLRPFKSFVSHSSFVLHLRNWSDGLCISRNGPTTFIDEAQMFKKSFLTIKKCHILKYNLFSSLKHVTFSTKVTL